MIVQRHISIPLLPNILTAKESLLGHFVKNFDKPYQKLINVVFL